MPLSKDTLPLPGPDGVPPTQRDGGKPARADEEPKPGTPAAHLVVERRSRRSTIVGLVVLAIVVLVGIGSFRACSWFADTDKPLATKTTDRTGPVVLKSIQDLSRYQAATGTFQLVVDLEKDVKYVPASIAGQRTLFVAAGTVDAYVDFSGLTSSALTVSEDRKSVILRLPAPALEKPNLDLDESYVFAERRGLVDRFTSLWDDDPNRLQDVYKAASAKIADSAKKTNLGLRAQTNTRAMLMGLFRSLGYTSVTVTFSAT